MSIVGQIVRKTGLYDRFHTKFFEEMLRPYATAGQIKMAEAEFLATLTREARGTGPIVEVGMLFGSSTRVILLNKAPGQKVLAVDSFSWNPAGLSPDEHFEIARASMKEFGGDEDCQIVRADKNEFYRTYKGPTPALVFLDADHSYAETKKDIDWAKSVNATIICGHDYSSDFPGVKQAVDEAGGAAEIHRTLWRLKKADA